MMLECPTGLRGVGRLGLLVASTATRVGGTGGGHATATGGGVGSAVRLRTCRREIQTPNAAKNGHHRKVSVPIAAHWKVLQSTDSSKCTHMVKVVTTVD